MQKNLDALGAAYMAYGAWLVFWTGVATTFMLVAGAVLTNDPDAWVLWAFAPVVFVIGAMIAAPFVVAGRGLQLRRPWARWAAFALVFLSIGSFPVGFVLGVLALVVLTDKDAAAEFAPASA